MDMGSSSGSSESQLLNIGLKFGQKVYFEDVGVGVQPKSRGGSSPATAAGGGGGDGGPQKKGRTGVSVQGSLGHVHQPPRCQVEGCNIDLSDAKTYYSRHKVCGVHSKTPKVIVNGLEQRFCQQCSRFHQLPEFDQGKRSCRRRLAGHNERRRKPQPGTLLSTRYGSLSSSIFDNNGRNGGFLMDFSMNSRGNRLQWPPNTTRSSSNRAAHDLPPPPWQQHTFNTTPNVTTDGGVSSSSNSNCALSLLSNQQSSGSRAHTLSLEYYVDPGAAMAEPVGQFSGTSGSWGYESDGAHMGLGSMAQADFCGELGLGQQSGSRYDDSGDHVHWSL